MKNYLTRIGTWRKTEIGIETLKRKLESTKQKSLPTSLFYRHLALTPVGKYITAIFNWLKILSTEYQYPKLHKVWFVFIYCYIFPVCSIKITLMSKHTGVSYKFNSIHNLKWEKELEVKTEKLIKIKSDVSGTEMPVPQTLRSWVLIIPQKSLLWRLCGWHPWSK